MKHTNTHFVFFEAMNSGWSDPKNPIWVSTTGITYPTKELAEEANKHMQKKHKNSHIKYKIVKTTVYKEDI